MFHFFSKKISTTHFPWYWNRATSFFLGKDQAGKLTPPIFFFMWLTYLFTFHKSCSNFEREIRIRAKKLRNEGRRLCLHSISCYPLMLGLCLTTKSCLPPSWKTDDDVDFCFSKQFLKGSKSSEFHYLESISLNIFRPKRTISIYSDIQEILCWSAHLQCFGPSLLYAWHFKRENYFPFPDRPRAENNSLFFCWFLLSYLE